MAQQRANESFWQYGDRLDDEGGMGAVGGISPSQLPQHPGANQLHRTASEEVQHALGDSLGLGNQEATATANRRPEYGSFDPLDHARLSPSAFDPNTFSNQFAMPRFASGGASDPFGFGVGVADPLFSGNNGFSPMPFDYNFGAMNGSTPRGEQTPQPSFFPAQPPAPSNSQPVRPTQQPQQGSESSTASSHSTPFSQQPPSSSGSNLFSQHASPSHTSFAVPSTSAAPAMYTNPSLPQQVPSIPQPYRGLNGHLMAPTSSELESPIYAPYGSSVISVNNTPQTAGYKLPSLAMNLPPSQPGVTAFNPAEMGLPAPPPKGESSNFAGLYSSSGFDMLGVLARVAARPNPQIQIGPVDMSCAFAVVDARRYDQPLVFVSDTFRRMTGYDLSEIIGRNCRFLQSPGGATIQGAPRKYTDSNAAWHMRQHIQSGKESQSSLINYTKSGRPFINLVTIIPICWDTDEIAYYVGFQVDLVDQPNAILNRMRDGSYCVNYSLVGQQYNGAIIPNPKALAAPTEDGGKTVSMDTIEGNGGMAGLRPEPDEWNSLDDLGVETLEDSPPAAATATEEPSPAYQAAAPRLSASQRPSAAEQMAGGGGELSTKSNDELLDLVAQRGIGALALEVDRRAFHKLVLGQADDFVHVLSLKGSVLYCSPSVEKLLEYQPGELVGTTLASLCHPSDVVPVMRHLKDASSATSPYVHLLYRIRRKHSGYVWIEAIGKLHIEPAKGRKCVIAMARPREVARINWNELRQSGGMGDTEFFLKIGEAGTVLFATAGVQTMLGIWPQEAVGCSLFDLAHPEYRSQIEVAIQQAQLGASATISFKIRNRKGASVDVVTSKSEYALLFCSAQINELSSEQRKANSIFTTTAPVYSGTQTGSPAASEDGSNSGGSNSGNGGTFHSTFKSLSHPSSVSDNVLDELEVRRPTSWQFELHQLQNTNKKLKDEKDYLIAIRRKHTGSYSERSRKGSAASDAGSRASSDAGRVCQNCGRTSSPEWRAGPGGAKTLCNACGLRYAKKTKQIAKDGSNSMAPLPSPTSSTGSTLSAFAPLSISSNQLGQPSNGSPPQYAFGLATMDETSEPASASPWPQ
ncbi:hypothetical protein JCM11641_007425 [Rhodosporidiobolus odoratus]